MNRAHPDSSVIIPLFDFFVERKITRLDQLQACLDFAAYLVAELPVNAQREAMELFAHSIANFSVHLPIARSMVDTEEVLKKAAEQKG